LQSLSKNPDIATTLQAITTLKLTSLLPDKAGTGTFFVPKNLAYATTGVLPHVGEQPFCGSSFISVIAVNARAHRSLALFHEFEGGNFLDDYMVNFVFRCAAHGSADHVEKPDSYNLGVPFSARPGETRTANCTSPTASSELICVISCAFEPASNPKHVDDLIVFVSFLWTQGKTLSRSLLVKSSPIPSDLSLIAGVS
jgi:hypothetical protein